MSPLAAAPVIPGFTVAKAPAYSVGANSENEHQARHQKPLDAGQAEDDKQNNEQGAIRKGIPPEAPLITRLKGYPGGNLLGRAFRILAARFHISSIA